MIDNDLHEFPVSLVEDIASRYRDFKISESVYDYTDMLIMARDGDLNIPKLHTIFIDEAQDLSTLQWILVNRMAEFADHIVILGDDKQSINAFAGADVETFLNLPGKVEVLEQSYRIPRRVFDLANKIMGNMTNYRKEGSNWKPRKEEGTCRNVQSIPYQHMISGDWLVLARTSYQLENIAQSLLQRTEDGALMFNINGSAPIDVDIFRVIEMMKLAELPGAQPLTELFQIKDTDTKEQRAQKIDYIKMFKKFIPHTPTKQPWEMCKVFREHLEMPWREAMERVPPYLKRYASRIYPLYKEKGESLFADASIRLMTVHAAKGREATNVLAIMDVPKSVKDTISNKETDVECKTLYVAVTRTKKNLYIYRANRYGIGLDIYL